MIGSSMRNSRTSLLVSSHGYPVSYLFIDHSNVFAAFLMLMMTQSQFSLEMDLHL